MTYNNKKKNIIFSDFPHYLKRYEKLDGSEVIKIHYYYLIEDKDVKPIENDVTVIFKKKYKNKLFFFILVVDDTYTDKNFIDFTYQNYDKYLIGNNKPLKNLDEVLYMQYLDKKHMDINNISTSYLMALTSNKLVYTQFLIDKGLIYNTKIIDNKTVQQKFQGYVLKYPYSSTEKCVFINKLKKNYCFKEEGYILQKFNDSIEQLELKCHTTNGKILYIAIRIGKSFYICCDKNLVTGFKYVDNLLKKYSKEIKSLCFNTYLEMNKLVNLYKIRTLKELNILYSLLKKKTNTKNISKLNNALKNINKSNLNIEPIMLSPCKNRKITLLNKIKCLFEDCDLNKGIDLLIKLLEVPYSQYEGKFNESIDTIYDEYMRIDIALPDNKDYNKCYINEVEPYACGKTDIYVVRKCLVDSFEYKNEKILSRIISRNIKNYDKYFEKLYEMNYK